MKLRIFVTHPVQYHVPLWRALARHPQLDVKVFYFNDQSVRGGRDREFGVEVKWDVDLLSGYRSEFLTRDADLDHHAGMRITAPSTLLRAERPDWVWLSGYTHRFEQQLALLAPLHGARLVMRAEFSDLHARNHPAWKAAARHAYLRAFYSRVSAFCYPGQQGLAHLLAHGVPRARTHFSPYAVDDALIDASRSGLDRVSARQALGLTDDTFAFLLSGKLIPRKNPLALLDAIERMSQRGRVALIALGDGELRSAFEPRARALLGDRFVFPGFVNQTELARFFVAADAVVMPSEHETWGLVVNEAMHHGLPVIVSDRTGCHHDLVVPGVTGWTYPTGDTAMLAQRMDAMAADPRRASEMGRAARLHGAGYTIERAAAGVFEALGVSP